MAWFRSYDERFLKLELEIPDHLMRTGGRCTAIVYRYFTSLRLPAKISSSSSAGRIGHFLASARPLSWIGAFWWEYNKV